MCSPQDIHKEEHFEVPEYSASTVRGLREGRTCIVPRILLLPQDPLWPYSRGTWEKRKAPKLQILPPQVNVRLLFKGGQRSTAHDLGSNNRREERQREARRN